MIYNASSRVPGPLSSVDPAAVEKSIAITTFGAFLAAQQAAQRMEPKGRGAIFFTGASAGMKGFAQSAAFAMDKFGLRGLAQSAARELGPKGIRVRTSTSTGASAQCADRTRAISLTARSIPTQSPRPTSTSSRSRETPGRTKSTFGPGQNDSRRRSAVRHSRFDISRRKHVPSTRRALEQVLTDPPPAWRLVR